MLAWIHSHYEKIVLITTLVGLIGVFYSTALTSASIIVLAVAGMSFVSAQKMKEIFKDRKVIPLTLVFLVVLISGLYSQDGSAWMTAVRVKLPFLLLPIAYYLGPSLSKKFVIQLHYWLVVISVIVGLPVFFLILKDVQSATDLISIGQSVVTPIEHVKYSMMVAHAAITAWVLYRHDHANSSSSRWLVLLAAVLLAALLHIMAIRTGLVIFYVSLVLLAIFYLLRKRDRMLGVIMMIGAIAIPLVAIEVVPTLKQKIGYMLHDWSKYQNEEGASYSDSERMLSYKGALSIIKTSPLLGVGYGDVRTEVKEYYKKEAQRPDLQKLPHSQYLTYLSGVGLIGFLIFICGFYQPVIASYKNHKKENILFGLLLLLYLNYSLSFFIENSLDRSMSVAFFLLLSLPLLKFLPLEGDKEGGKNQQDSL